MLLNTAAAFLQGLYPPLGNLDQELATQTLNNNMRITNPLGGYQYLVVHGENEDSPDTIWLKGDEECPAVAMSIEQHKESPTFKQRIDETRSFYQSF